MKKLYWAGGALMLPVLFLAVMFHMDPILITIGTYLLVGICIVVNAFVIVYSQRSWHTNEGGRAIMYTMASFAALADLTLATTFLGRDWEWRGALRVFLFGGIFITISHMLFVLLRAPGNARREDQRNARGLQ
jgi:Na+/melibiose symporter-like transporter